MSQYREKYWYSVLNNCLLLITNWSGMLAPLKLRPNGAIQIYYYYYYYYDKNHDT